MSIRARLRPMARSAVYRAVYDAFRKSHVIEQQAGAGTDYQTFITVHYGEGVDSGADVYLGEKCKPDFGDLRVTSSDGTTIIAGNKNGWREDKVDGDYAKIWIKIPDNLSLSEATIYLYYGKADAVWSERGYETFLWFEDWETGQPTGSFYKYYAGNPVVTYGGVGDWDEHSVRACSVVYVGTTYYLYYHGHEQNPNTFPRKIGLATSGDGYSYTKSGSNPIFSPSITPGDWDDYHVGIPKVLYYEGIYWMYYSGQPSADGIPETGLATSVDGVNFTRTTGGIGGTSKILAVGGLGAWDEVLAQPCGILSPDESPDGQFWLYYIGMDSGVTRAIGLARSSDGVTFTKYVGNPIVSPTQAWEGNEVNGWAVWYDPNDGNYKAFYRGHLGVNCRIGFAESSDGISWTKWGHNPTPPLLGSAGEFDEQYMISPWFIYKQGNPSNLGLLYYTGINAADRNQIGVMSQMRYDYTHEGWEKDTQIGPGDLAVNEASAYKGTYGGDLRYTAGTIAYRSPVPINTVIGALHLHLKPVGANTKFYILGNQWSAPKRWLHGDPADHKFKYFDGGAWNTFPIDTPWAAGNWYEVECRFNETADTFDMIIDGVEIGSGLSAADDIADIDYVLQYLTGFVEHLYTDNWFLRKYIDPEPIHGEWGDEEIIAWPF